MSHQPNDPSTSKAAESEKIPNVKANLAKAFLKSLILPVCMVALYMAAPHWLNNSLRESINKDISEDTKHTEAEKTKRIEFYSKVDFLDVVLNKPEGSEKLHETLERIGIAGQYRRLHWGFLLSVGLVGLLVASSLVMLVLNQVAKQSKEKLILCYRLSWMIGMVTSFMKLLLLVPLMTYGAFELMVLLMESYSPKLLFVIAFCGLIALLRSATILIRKVPLEFHEAMAREVTPEQAPELWQAVRDAAARLNTTPPDRILIGLQLNCYVTELAVNYGSGKTQGRTLYLSHPFLKQFSEEETLAVIGHELGHFIGEDTRMSREFYPMRFKAHATMVALAQSAFVGWPSLQFLSFFDWCFSETEQKLSREREILADQKAAELTSPQIMGRALVKLHAVSEAFNQSFMAAVRNETQSPFDLPMQSVIREKLPVGAKFWTELFEKKSQHPLDSHPTLQVRLAALGQNITVDQAHALATEESESAYAKWFGHRGELFKELTQEAEAVVEKLRSRVQVAEADYKSEAGKELLEKHFPEKRWKVQPSKFWTVTIALGVAVVGFVAIAVWLNEKSAAIILGIVAAIGALLGTVFWVRHRNGEFCLKVDGINYTGWKQPLRFEDAERMSAQNVNGILSLTFRLKQSQPSRWKMTLFPFPRKSISFSVNGLNEKQEVVAQTIYEYFTRQIREK